MSPPKIEKPLFRLHSFLPTMEFAGFDDLSDFTGGRSHTVLTIWFCIELIVYIYIVPAVAILAQVRFCSSLFSLNSTVQWLRPRPSRARLGRSKE